MNLDDIMNEPDSPEIPQETNTSEQIVETTEDNIPTNETEEENKPWKTPKHVPYTRFSETIAEKNQYKKQVEELQKQLESIKKPESSQEYKLENLDSIDIQNFEDFKEYDKQRAYGLAKDLTPSIKEQVKAEILREMQQEQEQKKVQEYHDTIMKNFSERIESAKAKDPEVLDAVNYLNENAAYIPEHIRVALITDEHPGEVIKELLTTPGLLQEVMGMNYVESTRKLAKLSSKYDNESIPETIQQKKIPTPNLKGKPVSGQIKYSDDMSNAEFREWARANKIRI